LTHTNSGCAIRRVVSFFDVVLDTAEENDWRKVLAAAEEEGAEGVSDQCSE
jgi:hypothetical protein